MKPSHRDFLRAIIAAPSDDLPRLAYADFLEESGYAERVKFIRVQCWDKHGGQYTANAAMAREYRPLAMVPDSIPDSSIVVIKRGFLAEIHLTLSQFFGGQCAACGGHGPQIFRDHPVERVVLSDREPYLYKPNGSYRFYTMNQDYMPYDLPAEIIKNMCGDYGYDSSQRQYPNREAAIDALSQACCRWARAEADKLEAVTA